MYGQGNRVWINNGTGTFTDSGQSLGASHSRGVSLGDVDGDGDLDAFIANSHNQGNKVWRNDGSGNFSDSGQSLGTSYSHKVKLDDVDDDGDLDAFITNGGNQSNNRGGGLLGKRPLSRAWHHFKGLLDDVVMFSSAW